MTWLDKKRRERGLRARERQLEYQTKKARGLTGSDDQLVLSNFARSQTVRRRLEAIRPLAQEDRVLEVGSGAHGLVFGLGAKHGFGIDPLAVEYRRLFPKMQTAARTIAAIGEQLPFEDRSFDVVISDNVIDHAERPLKILEEIVRVLRPDGILFFTVNVHHPIYQLASWAHGAWNALGIRAELSAFADHTVHLTEGRIAAAIHKLPLRILFEASTITETSNRQREAKVFNIDSLSKKIFYKNAVFEVLAQRLP